MQTNPDFHKNYWDKHRAHRIADFWKNYIYYNPDFRKEFILIMDDCVDSLQLNEINPTQNLVKDRCKSLLNFLKNGFKLTQIHLNKTCLYSEYQVVTKRGVPITNAKDFVTFVFRV
jgi:hypothetical protein